ncbi:hypothetical protein CFP56_015306 [Quercus suber]|uniref:Uncharacterized protein n=1 Tax=Quercus suber TaxID=58331 RepID=A0AAW0M4V9_QUESU|nr:hypothetical protein CFP56_08301 [Quercus suber]
MSVFGSSHKAICADYFGDEFGLPLPLITKMENKAVPKAIEAADSAAIEALSDNKSGTNNSIKQLAKEPQGPQRVTLAFAPALDGLDCFETLVFR